MGHCSRSSGCRGRGRDCFKLGDQGPANLQYQGIPAQSLFYSLFQSIRYLVCKSVSNEAALMLETPATRTHLRQLEAESIHIIREVAAEFENPVMMYSIGKDSSVMLHLASKAFYPAPPPFPLLHIDTTWKFREMIEFRNRTAKKLGMELIVYTNEEGKAANINPFDHGSSKYTDVMKTA